MDKRYCNDEARTLGLKELESVAGGRAGFRASEERDMINVREKVQRKMETLRAAGKNKEADALDRKYWDAYDEWIDCIKCIPENGPDVFISDFIEV